MKLTEIKAAADRKYAKVPVEISAQVKVYLLSPVSMQDDKLDEVLALLEDPSSQGIRKRLEQVIQLVAETPAQGKKLVDACKGNLGVLLEITREWSSELKVGEASPSED